MRIGKPLLLITLSATALSLLSLAAPASAQQAGYNVSSGIRVGHSEALNESDVADFRRAARQSGYNPASPTRSSANPLAYQTAGASRAVSSANSSLRIGQPLLGGAQPRRLGSSAGATSYSRNLGGSGTALGIRSLRTGGMGPTGAGYTPFGTASHSGTRGSLLANRRRGLTSRVGLSRTDKRLTARRGLGGRRSPLIGRAGLAGRGGVSNWVNR